VPGTPSGRGTDRAPAPRTSPSLIPCLLLRKGQVCLPSPSGPIVARGPDGELYDPFDVVDRLTPEYSTLYVVDLDGIERADPQLDYLQELSRDVTLWADAGVRNAEQAIDVLVTGVSKAVLSSATITQPKEVRRAWKLSSDLLFEIDLTAQGPTLRGEWPTRDARGVAETVRATGLTDLIVSPREIDVDWTLVRSLAQAGSVWVDGSFSERESSQLTSVGAAGGIFHLDGILGDGHRPLPSDSTRPTTLRGAR
jgi:phosphoribosylformimino-5-aminoimidazole carboxamide ribonucleotide (ProFAR) isomerase